jgi:hypothetical protein
MSVQPLPREAPHTVHAETPHFIFRTLDVDDACESWCEWLLDPQAQVNLNAKPIRMSLDKLRAYVASFDRVTSHIAGIFEKEGGRLVGIRNAYVDRSHSECLLNTLIGEAGARGKGAQRETRYPWHNFALEDLDLESARAGVVGDNAYQLKMLAETGWVCEHTSLAPRANGGGFVRLHHFRLTREVWRAWAGAKAKVFLEPSP